MGEKSHPKESLVQNLIAKTIPCQISKPNFIYRTMWLGYAGTLINLEIVSNTPKNPYLPVHQATEKNT